MFIERDLIEHSKTFLREAVEEGSATVVVYHGDGDGCCSAFLMKEFLGRLGFCGECKFYWVATPEFDFIKVGKFLDDQKPQLTIFLDLPVPLTLAQRLGRKGKVFIYDHHVPSVQHFMGSAAEQLLYVNPILHQNGPSFPTALFTWQLYGCEEESLAMDILFMALFTESWLDKVSLFRNWGMEKKRFLKELAKLIHGSFLIQSPNTVHYALEFLSKLPKGGLLPGDLPEFKEYTLLKDIYNLVQREKSGLTSRILQQLNLLERPRYILKRIVTKIYLCGLIASELRWRYPLIPVAIWQRWGEVYHCELRRGKACRLNLVELINYLKEQITLISGGGHPEAAGFTANHEEFFKALEIMRERLRNQSS